MKFLKQPYPYSYALKEYSLILAVGVGVFIFFFTYLVKPFGFDQEIKVDLWQACLGYGVTSFLGVFLALFVIPMFSKSHFNEARWTVGQEIFWILFLLLVVGVLNFVLMLYVSSETCLQKTTLWGLFFKSIGNTMVIGAIPTVFIVMWNQLRLMKKHIGGISQVEQTIKDTSKTTNKTITLIGENKNETLEIPLEDFFFAQADGNYVEVLFKNGESISKEIIRSTLTHVEDQLNDYSDIKRVHRKFLANFSNVLKVSGNAQGYKLHYDQIGTMVPVSRKLSKELFG
jgi:hypothetical protein